MGVEVFRALDLMMKGLSDTGLSSQGVSGREKGGMELPLAGVDTAPPAWSFCITRMGVLSTPVSPPTAQPGDRGSISVIVLTGVSHFSPTGSTAIGVRLNSSLADRGSRGETDLAKYSQYSTEILDFWNP